MAQNCLRAMFIKENHMPNFTVRLAEQTVAISTIHSYTQTLCRSYLTDEPPAYIIRTTQEDIAAERDKSAREHELEERAPRFLPDGYLESLAVYRKIAQILLDDGVLLFHGSVVAVDGAGVLFTAKSGTGKSTHTRLWREVFGSRAVMVNDDKPLLRITDGHVTAYGTPWDGKHRLSSNIAVPLKSVCILERGRENRIVPITKREAYPMLMQQSYRPGDSAGMLKVMELADKLGSTISLYRLWCNMEREAAEIAYKAMS